MIFVKLAGSTYALVLTNVHPLRCLYKPTEEATCVQARGRFLGVDPRTFLHHVPGGKVGEWLRLHVGRSDVYERDEIISSLEPWVNASDSP